MLRVLRLIRHFRSSRFYNSIESQFASSMESVPPLKTMKAVVQAQKGGPETLKIGEIPFPVAQEGETLVKIQYTGLNRTDTRQREGKVNPPPGAPQILGIEFLGVECDNTGSPLPTAKPVMGIVKGGGYAEYVRVPKPWLIRVPEGVEIELAASIPEVWQTSYQLINIAGGGIQKGQFVLVHAAASGIGTSALQLLKHYEAKAIAVSSTKEKLDTCKSLGAYGCVNYKETAEFSEQVMALTEGHGVDMILDCVGGSHFDQNQKSLAKEGTWVIFGNMGGSQCDLDINKMKKKQATMVFTSMRTKSIQFKGKLATKFEQEIVPLFEKGALKPIVNCVMPLSQVESAHKLIETNTTIGKIVLKNDL